MGTVWRGWGGDGDKPMEMGAVPMGTVWGREKNSGDEVGMGMKFTTVSFSTTNSIIGIRTYIHGITQAVPRFGEKLPILSSIHNFLLQLSLHFVLLCFIICNACLTIQQLFETVRFQRQGGTASSQTSAPCTMHCPNHDILQINGQKFTKLW